MEGTRDMNVGEVCTGFWWSSLNKRDHLEQLSVDGNIVLKWIFNNWDEGPGPDFIWLRIETGGELL
jgi:hypothetical protein